MEITMSNHNESRTVTLTPEEKLIYTRAARLLDELCSYSGPYAEFSTRDDDTLDVMVYGDHLDDVVEEYCHLDYQTPPPPGEPWKIDADTLITVSIDDIVRVVEDFDLHTFNPLPWWVIDRAVYAIVFGH